MKSDEIDDSFYSRQRYVFGDKAMLKLNKSCVLIVGLGGVGVEIAKNVILSGVQKVVLKDEVLPTVFDLGNQFYIREEDLTSGKTRAEICLNKLRELNQHVKVDLYGSSTLNFDTLHEFDCIVLTESSLKMILQVDSFCFRQHPPIKLVVADVYGILGVAFCDFGHRFEILDKTGEDPQEYFVADISRDAKGVVTLTDEQRVGSLNDGDFVAFREVQGMTQLNGQTRQIKLLTPYSFEIGDTSVYDEYSSGGICSEIVSSSFGNHTELKSQRNTLKFLTFNDVRPEIDVSSHVAYFALHDVQAVGGNNSVEERSHLNSDQFLDVCQEIYARLNPKPDFELDEKFLNIVTQTYFGQLTPLCSFVGGLAAQEVLKAVTCKFTPLNQWMFLSCPEVYGLFHSPYVSKKDRYDANRVCIGDAGVDRLKELKIFLVGCGAIGCELLKIFALLGVACNSVGDIVVTDNDIIEKSNLNRQFLFHDRHVRMPKSDVGAASVREINPVCTESEGLFSDDFFCSRQVIVNALDNIEARLYVDARCVSSERPLLDSGTMGTKGSVQVVLPHLTENYGSSRDPEDQSVLMCTLKSFPATVNHTILWARNKFESLFVDKASKFNSFWLEHESPEKLLSTLTASDNVVLPANTVAVLKLLDTRPQSLANCVCMARLKFEKYFNHKAKQLLNVFPLDHRLKDGSLFWQLPKRPPKPLEFGKIPIASDFEFVASLAKLFAVQFGVDGVDTLDANFVEKCLENLNIPEFQPKNKKIATDDVESQPGSHMESDESVDIDWCVNQLKRLVSTVSDGLTPLTLITFEKDDDLHVDFVTATSNLRAIMYGLEPSDRYATKKVAGKIIPAISTTTACVSGLVSLELIKLALNINDLTKYRNCYLNLAFPLVLFAQPQAVEKKKISDDVYVSVWDKCKIYGDSEYTLQNLIKELEKKYNGIVTMVAEGKKALFMPPMFTNKTQMLLSDLSEFSSYRKFTDLCVTMDKVDDGCGDINEDLSIDIPTVRYFFEA